MKWNGERVEMLRAMWLQGASAGDIARRIGDVTRNAVMGKVHRLGLIGNQDHNSRMESVPMGCCRPIRPEPVEDVIRVRSGTMQRTWAALAAAMPPSWRTACSLVEDLTGTAYDPATNGHRASLIGISTILSQGDPRRILVPMLSEPTVLGMMRRLAEKGLVVGGKTPERWRDEETGDVSFFGDMLAAEDVQDHHRLVAFA